MFSSIRSYLLGTPAPAAAEPQVQASDAATSSANESASSLLELTLSAATSKITEQLLPPSASIEQLQSSSHQLLPTLNEQHQEDEMKKLKKESENSLINNELTDDESECFNDDSWELLDLVEKPSSASNSKDRDESSNSTVQDVLCVNMSTLLMRHDEAAETTANPEEPIVVVRSQKQLKVSFKTPDLVMERESKIDQVGSFDFAFITIADKAASRKNKKKKKKHTLYTPSPEATDLPKEDENEDRSLKTGPEIVHPVEPKKPILNYAQVLKPKYDAGLSTKNNSQELRSDARSVSTLKRNRTVSTTSWSSGDEAEVLKYWDDDVEAAPQIAEKPFRVNDEANCLMELKPEVNEVDNKAAVNESMISSTFSDFDSRYQEINDFVLKPKKRRNKKQKRSPSTSSVPVLKQANQNRVEIPKKNCENETATTNNRSNLNKLKPKKKNLTSSANVITSSVDFVKTLDGSNKVQCVDSTKSNRKGRKNHSNSSESKIATSSSPVCSSFGCTDSSDGPDMDESWFVTPPSCFTNVNKTKSPLSKSNQAHRENELIEHPTVYFSNGSKDSYTQSDVDGKKKIFDDNSFKDSAKAAPIGRNIELKKKEACNNSKSSYVKLEFKKGSNTKSPREGNMKKSAVSCDNKFIVTNWAFDEQDDIDDFDNMFEDECSFEEEPKVSLKKKTKKKQNKVVEQIISDSPVSMDSSVDSNSMQDTSPVPVEIDEISILSVPKESIDANKQINDLDEVQDVDENTRREIVGILTRRRRTTSGEKKTPVPVQPIEPERKPGWQLKRKRNKRRFFSSSMPLNQGTVKTIKDKYAYADNSSTSTSARSTPCIIDRIGSSIVANLTSLASDFPCSSGLAMQSRAPMQELDNLNSIAVKKSNSELELINRKKLSKGFLDRQNSCVKLGNTKRREGRGLKMHKTFNGYSVDRKVQTNFPKSQ